MWRRTAAGLLVALALVACSGDDESVSDPGETTTATTIAPVTEPAETTIPAMVPPTTSASSSATAPTSTAQALPTPDCLGEFERIVSIGEFEDTVRDYDDALTICTSLDDWTVAANETVIPADRIDDPATFAYNRCLDLGEPDTPVCVEALESASTREEPSAIRRIRLWEQGVDAANRLADAFVSQDWETVRRLAPTNPYTEAELEAGYAGLVDQELALVDHRSIDSQRVVLHFMLFADELRPEETTSVYCVRWDYDAGTGTIVQQLGVLVDSSPGFSRDALGGAHVCSDFQRGTFTDVPEPADGSTLIGHEIDGRSGIEFGSERYICLPPPRLLGVARECGLADSDGATGLWCWRDDPEDTYWDCTDGGFFPVDLDGLDVATIRGQRSLCQEAEGLCWIWDEFEQPTEAIFFDPDYRCVNDLCQPA